MVANNLEVNDMNAKHTAGPWWAYNRHGARIFKGWSITNGAGVVARVDIEPSPETQYANARLIAAAPDLLEALEDVCALRDFPDSAKGRAAAGRGDPYRRARAAIAKATGTEG